MKRELSQREEEVNMQEEKYANIQQEVDIKTKKLKKVSPKQFRMHQYSCLQTFQLWNKVQQTRIDIQDAQEDINKEREDVLFNIRELSKQLKLKMLMINRYVGCCCCCIDASI